MVKTSAPGDLKHIKNANYKLDTNALYSKKTRYFRAPFLVLQVVTNRGLYSVPGRTK